MCNQTVVPYCCIARPIEEVVLEKMVTANRRILDSKDTSIVYVVFLHTSFCLNFDLFKISASVGQN